MASVLKRFSCTVLLLACIGTQHPPTKFVAALHKKRFRSEVGRKTSSKKRKHSEINNGSSSADVSASESSASESSASESSASESSASESSADVSANTKKSLFLQEAKKMLARNKQAMITKVLSSLLTLLQKEFSLFTEQLPCELTEKRKKKIKKSFKTAYDFAEKVIGKYDVRENKTEHLTSEAAETAVEIGSFQDMFYNKATGYVDRFIKVSQKGSQCVNQALMPLRAQKRIEAEIMLEFELSYKEVSEPLQSAHFREPLSQLLKFYDSLCEYLLSADNYNPEKGVPDNSKNSALQFDFRHSYPEEDVNYKAQGGLRWMDWEILWNWKMSYPEEGDFDWRYFNALHRDAEDSIHSKFLDHVDIFKGLFANEGKEARHTNFYNLGKPKRSYKNSFNPTNLGSEVQLSSWIRNGEEFNILKARPDFWEPVTTEFYELATGLWQPVLLAEGSEDEFDSEDDSSCSDRRDGVEEEEEDVF